MPKPFPGMDPYMENPATWPDVHHALTTYIRDQLAPQIRPRYAARFTIRYVTNLVDGAGVLIMYPDVDVVEQLRGSDPPPSGASASIALAEAPPPLTLTTFVPTQTRLATVEIRNVETKALVTVIEVLSPVNKRAAAGGREEYLRKRGTLLQSDIHLLEIDLLRAGERVPMIDPLPDAPYFILLSRAERRPLCEVWPIGLSDLIPVVPVPLLPPDPDVYLDLGAALAQVYENAGYEDGLDYTQPPPPPPLTPADAAWVETVLRDRRNL